MHQDVKDYYGKRVQNTGDLLTGVCTIDTATFSAQAKEAKKMIHPDVLAKNYGCGAVYPEAVNGCSVLDLGSGAGIDCFVLSKLVGPDGKVVGVDMTQEQLDVARKYIGYHTDKFGYSQPNVEFREGYIENLKQAGLEDETFDIIISNCVVNLSPDKTAVLQEAFRVLKPGGEMYFSDIYSNQAIPEVLRKNKVLWGECVSGALQWQELMQIATGIGFAPPILVKSVVFESDNSKVTEFLASAGPDVATLKFCSATYRLIKPVRPLETVTASTRDPTIQVQYRGTIKGHENVVRFSFHGTLKKDAPVAMASSTAALLQSIPRFAPHFETAEPEGRGTAIDKSSTPEYPPLAEFLKVDPFEVASGRQSIGAPSCVGDGAGGGNQGCCASANTKKSCC